MRLRFNDDDVPMGAAGGIVVRHRLGVFYRQMEKECAAAVNIELLHANADGEQRNLLFSNSLEKLSIAVLAARRHRHDGGMSRLALASRVEVETAGEHEAIDLVEVIID